MPDEFSELLAWDVEVPGKQQTYSTWDRSPRGTLIIGNDGHEERIALPKSVARLLKSKLKSGEIHPASREQLLSIVDELSYICARTRIQRLTDRREYSSGEVRRKLREDGFPSATIEGCVSRACEVGLISDRRYADVFIRSKLSAGWGMTRISRELSSHGIEARDVPGWPYDYFDPEDELDRAVALARGKCRYGTPSFQKLARYLCGKGYGTGVATRAARMALDELDDDGLVDF